MASWWQPGQLLFVGFQGTELPPDLEALIAQGRVGGVILFSRNIESPEQLRGLVTAIHGAAPPEVPLLVGIDQEGGRVQRLRDPWTVWPPMRRLGDRNAPEDTRAFAAALARELVDMQIHLDFSPVVDVDTNPANPVIGDRSFARDPSRVIAHAVPVIEALQQAGVAACAKHFPGHGDTDLDSHLQLPRLAHDLDRLRAIELPPFAAAAKAGVASIMTAHVVFEAIDRKRPATISPEVMALLREEIGYDGVVFSDDFEMKAVADHHSPDALVRGCLEADVDAMLVCSDASLRDEVLQRLERSPDRRVERAIERVVAMKKHYAVRPSNPESEDPRDPAAREEPSGPPYPEHQDLARHLSDDG
ncbi:MAG: beta-N-acetylhexosaminidase [Myxococcota bacterium]